MKLAIGMALSSIMLTLSGAALAQGEIYHVPFQHVEIKATESIKAQYSFSSSKEVLVCQADQGSDALNSVQWTYKSLPRQLDLPVRLKDADTTTGQWADPSGDLVIVNHFGSSEPSGSLFVSCHYEAIA